MRFVAGVQAGGVVGDTGRRDGVRSSGQRLLAGQLLRSRVRARTAKNYGSTSEWRLAAPIDQIVSTPDGKGYWLVGSDGGIFGFGDAGFYGSMSSKTLNSNIVGMAPTADGKGYWLVGSDGGIFAFGDARYFGSLGGVSLVHPVVGIAGDIATGGYWEVTSNGAVSGYNAPSFGAIDGQPLAQPVVELVAAPDGRGYWIVCADGGISAFGSAGFHGSTAGVGLSAADRRHGRRSEHRRLLVGRLGRRGLLLRSALPRSGLTEPTQPGRAGPGRPTIRSASRPR